MSREEHIEQKKQAAELLAKMKSLEKKRKLQCFEIDDRTTICLSDEEDIEEYKKKYNIKKETEI